MSFRSRLRNVCLSLFAVLILVFGLTTTTAYAYGVIPFPQFLALIYLIVGLVASFIYIILHWRN